MSLNNVIGIFLGSQTSAFFQLFFQSVSFEQSHPPHDIKNGANGTNIGTGNKHEKELIKHIG